MTRIQHARRRLLGAACMAVAALAAVQANAQTYPAKPIRIVVPYAAGGGPDILGRLFANEMSKGFGSAFVDNKPGAGGNIGADNVAKSAADGYSLLMTTTATQAINPALYAAVPYDPIKDFTPIALVAFTPLMLATAPQSPFNSPGEVIALARSKPGTVTYASSGTGTMQHIAGELMQEQAGVSMVHVPYKGTSLVLPDLMTGRVAIMLNSTAAFAPFVKDGKLKALAVTSAQRLPGWPSVPTMSEAGLPGFEASAWYAVYGPANLAPDVTRALHREIARILELKTTRDRYAELGFEFPANTSPDELAATTRRDLARWTKLIKAKNIRAE